MPLLEIEGLRKSYEGFTLDDVSFSLDPGYIMGFIGVNGAGKTTTLKSMLNMVIPDAGKVSFFGRPFLEDQVEIKQRIGLLLSDDGAYPKRRVEEITKVTKRFYPTWDDELYRTYCTRFGIDQRKRICDLSKGMRVKYSLILALSHDAQLLILDEPTSGLDPAARDDVLELFQQLVEDGSKSILFSTHITSDLEKCADFISFIHEGRIIASSTKDELIESFRIVKGSNDRRQLLEGYPLISLKKNSLGFSCLIRTEQLDERLTKTFSIDTPTLEDIMIYHARKEAAHA